MPLFANKYSPWAHFPVPASPHFFLKHIQTYLIWWWCTWSRSLVMNQKWWWWGGKLCWGKQSRPGLVWGLIVKLSGRASRSQILDGSVPNTTSVRPCNYAHFGHHQLLQYYYLYFYYNHTVFDTYSQYRNYKYKYLYYHKYYVSSTLQLCSLRPPPPPAAAVLLLLLQSRCIW